MKFNWALLGLLAGIGIGAFGQAFGVEWLVAQVRAHVGWIAFACFAALFLIFAMGAVLQWLARRYLQPRYENVSDVLGDATTVVARTARLSDEDTEKAGQIIRSGVAIYGAWSFRLIMLRATVGLLLALGGVFTTYLLIQQNDRIAEQTEATKAQTALLENQLSLSGTQNEIAALNLVANLRERLARRPTRLPEGEIQAAIASLAPSEPSDGSCEIALTGIQRSFYSQVNPSERQAIADLALTSSVSDRVLKALNYLVADEDSSVALAAFEILQTVDGRSSSEVFLQNVYIDELNVAEDAVITLLDSYVDRISCVECTVRLFRSVMLRPEGAHIADARSSFVQDWPYTEQLLEAQHSGVEPSSELPFVSRSILGSFFQITLDENGGITRNVELPSSIGAALQTGGALAAKSHDIVQDFILGSYEAKLFTQFGAEPAFGDGDTLLCRELEAFADTSPFFTYFQATTGQ